MLVIKGAYYKYYDEVLIPHFTGDFHTVDCTRYITRDELEDTYGEDFIKENEEDTIEVDGETFYYAEYSPYHIAVDWELLSDLSDLQHNEQDFNF